MNDRKRMWFFRRILISVFFGGVIALAILYFSAMEGVSGSTKDILLWNANLAVKLAGNGPVIGQDGNGNPKYEGTPIHLFFWLLGLLSTFPIYMILTYIFVSLAGKLMPGNSEYKNEEYT